MELSSILEADIQGIQKQLKNAILSHQIGMMKLKKDPENVEAKKQIADAQSAIISLSTSQKFILQKLRNDMLANGLTKSSSANDSRRPNPVITVNGSTAPTLSSSHGHMGHIHNHQYVSPVKHRAPGVSIGTETIGLAAIGRENQPPKANGNFTPAAPNVGAEASPLRGKLANEGPPYSHRPHPTPPPPSSSIANRQHSRSPVDCSPQRLTGPRLNLEVRSSLSPYSSGGEDLDGDEDDDEDEEEVHRPNVSEAEDDMDELHYSSDDEKKDVVPPKEEVSPYKAETPAHPADDHDIDSKLKFFAALGLVTRETCSEMQSRRGERKRRSTANPQFVYGNWDFSVKRKKNGYLLSNSSPLQLRKRGRPRLDGSSELALFPTSFLPLPKSLSNIPYSGSKDANPLGSLDHFNENQHQYGISHQMLGHALGGALKPSQHYYAPESLGSGHHTKKPLEHINGNITIRKFCVVCKNISGPLVLCEECDVRYHPFCGKPIDGKRHCPKCETHHSASGGSGASSRVPKDEVSTAAATCREPAAVSSASLSSTVTCSAQMTTTSSALHTLAAERAAKVEEKRRLLLRNQELNAEKAKLEQRVSELSADLSAQAVRKRDLLSAEEKTRRSIKKVQDFIRNIQHGFKRSEIEEVGCVTSVLAAPCSVVTSDGVQAS